MAIAPHIHSLAGGAFILRKRQVIIAIVLIFIGLAFFMKSCMLSVKTGSFEQEDLVLIIDPGHGGADGGANLDGVCESTLNLDIALKLDNIMGLFAAPVALTRVTDMIQYPSGANSIRAKKLADQKNRSTFIKGFPNAVLISIHQNKFPDDAPHGAQVFFSKNPGSEDLALKTQTLLKSILEPGNKREANKIDSGIYLMKSIDCPAILVECGFLSNPIEFVLLQTEEYQIKIATAIATAYISSYEFLEEAHGKS